MPNYSATVENTDITAVINQWLKDWNVISYEYWGTVDIKLSTEYSYAACTFAETKQMFVRPEWCSPGVIAHEAAHISYSLLSSEEKHQFNLLYRPLITTDPYITLLYSQNNYGLVNDVEGHAEIYRYICEKLPYELKGFYPNLL
uniref:Uncharacterized protein n=1 Tax=viral metagenome TaxID=1070528 RepID=A0A6M3KKL1_9ZZZZ